jgi:hypothetical protein
MDLAFDFVLRAAFHCFSPVICRLLANAGLDRGLEFGGPGASLCNRGGSYHQQAPKTGFSVRDGLHASLLIWKFNREMSSSMVKKLEWIEMAQLAVSSILFKSLSLKLP